MITIITLTGLAILVLIIGFFEIRIPFIHFDSGKKKQHDSLIENAGEKESIKVDSNLKTIKNFFRFNKNDINFRMINSKKTSDVA